jgi:aminoglycoside phosphotransferase (APT) family kinase protein
MSDDETTVTKSSRDQEDLRVRLQQWLADRTGDPNAAIGALSSPSATGMSSESLFFDATWGDETGAFVARVAPDPADVPVFPTYDLEMQYQVIKVVGEKSDVPVPPLRWIENDPTALGVPFFVMERVEGRVPPDIPPYAAGSWVTELSDDDRAEFQRATIAVLAGIHGIETADTGFLEFDLPGDTPLHRHVENQRRFYEWVCADAGRRYPTLERAFDWLEANWPTESPAVISWGDARIGNCMYDADGVEPVAVLDWEMAALAPREVDLGWMCFLHTFFQYLLGLGGIDGLPGLLRPDDVVATYTELTGVEVDDLHWARNYAALRHGIVMARVHTRSVHFGDAVWPDDPDQTFMFADLVNAMLDGTAD